MSQGNFISGAVVGALLLAPAIFAIPKTGFAQVEEIVVTVRRREENLQDIPLVVTAFDAKEIERRGINSIADVTKQMSSLIFDLGIIEQDTRIVVRGLAPTRGRQNIATLVDGIDITSEAIATAGGSLLVNPRLIDLQRIEVVEGPQSALYGRSAFNGAIQYVTKDASDEFEVEVGMDGNWDDERYSVDASVSGPVIEDVLGLRLKAAWWDEEGYYKNFITQDTIGSTEGWGLALTANLNFGDNVTFKLRADHTDDEFGQPAQGWFGFNTTFNPPASALLPVPGGGPPVLGCNRVLEDASGNTGGFCDFPQPAFAGTALNADELTVLLAPDPATGTDWPGADREIDRVSLVGEWDVGTAIFTSWTGFTDATSDQSGDFGDFGCTIDPATGQLVLPPGGIASLPVDVLCGNYAGVDNGVGEDIKPRFSFFSATRDTKQFSQEIRFASNLDGPVQVTLGGQYWNEEVKQQQKSITALAIGVFCAAGEIDGESVCLGENPPITSTPVRSIISDAIALRGDGNPVNRETEHTSVYGMFDWELSDTWRVSFEGRYNFETESVEGPILPPEGQGPGTLILCGFVDPLCTGVEEDLPGLLPEEIDCRGDGTLITAFPCWTLGEESTDTNWFTPRVAVEWNPVENQMYYFSYAEGAKPGGISTLTVGSAGLLADQVRFGMEEMTVYEVGAKTDWFDRALVFNTTVYFQDFTDKQVNTSILLANGNTAPRILNAGGAEIWGAQFDITWRPEQIVLGGQWGFQGSYTYLDTEYTEFEVLSDSAFSIARAGNCNPLFLEEQGTSTCRIDSSGNELEGAPPNAFTGSVSYTTGLFDTGADFFIETDVQFQDDRYAEFDNIVILPAFWNTDLRVGFEGERWEVLAYVNNVFDDNTVRSVLSAAPGLGCCFLFAFGVANNEATVGVDVPSVSLGAMPPPRNYGLRARFRF
jgi:outer membrane receptor protein involved in Fe transport